MDTLVKTAATGLVAGGASATGGAIINEMMATSENSGSTAGGYPGIKISMNTNLKKMLELFRAVFIEIDCLQQMMVENKVSGLLRMLKNSTITIQPSSGDNSLNHIPIEPVAVAMDIVIDSRNNDHEHAEVTFLRKVIMSSFELKDEQARYRALGLLPSFIEQCIRIVDKNTCFYHHKDF